MLIPFLIVTSPNPLDKYKEAPDVLEGEGIAIVSGIPEYLFNFFGYFFIKILDTIFQHFLKFSLMEIWSSLGAISTCFLFVDAIIVIIIVTIIVIRIIIWFTSEYL